MIAAYKIGAVNFEDEKGPDTVLEGNLAQNIVRHSIYRACVHRQIYMRAFHCGCALK